MTSSGPPGTITATRSWLVDSGGAKRWVFVRLETEDGIVGWGECFTAPGREPAIKSIADHIGRHLIGRSVFATRFFTSVMVPDFATKRGSMELYCASSGLEIAMWDAIGKTVGEPVYNLLGGPCRERIGVYANGWSSGANESLESSVDVTVAAAVELVERGFRALKFDPFPGPWRTWLDGDHQRQAIDCVRAVREAVGPDVDLLIEGHRRFSGVVARRLARALAPFDPFWFEEPVPSDQVESLRHLRRLELIPIVTGEDLYTLRAFTPVLERRAADIINPDVGSCGGILEIMSIGAAAAARDIAIAPHNYNSTGLALAATVHAAAALPNFLITEYFVNFEERTADIVSNPLIPSDGYLNLPEGPGLGVEVREKALDRFSADQHDTLRTLPTRLD